jgi:hypothetical protein
MAVSLSGREDVPNSYTPGGGISATTLNAAIAELDAEKLAKTDIGDTAIPRFATAAARTTAMPSPSLNQVSMLDTRPGKIQWWTGTAWVDHPPLEKEFYIAGGTYAPGSNTLLSAAVETLAYSGKVVMHGMGRFRNTGTAADQTVEMIVDSTSIGGVPTMGLVSTINDSAFKFVMVPFMAVWNNVAAGSFQPKIKVTIGGGAPTIICDFVAGTWRLVGI